MGGYELLQVERLEVGAVLEILHFVLTEGQSGHSHCGGTGLDETGRLRRKDRAALRGAVAYEKSVMPLKKRAIAIGRVDNFRLRLA